MGVAAPHSGHKADREPGPRLHVSETVGAEQETAPTTVAFVLAIPYFTPYRDFPDLLAQACDRHVNRLNHVGMVDDDTIPWHGPHCL